MSITITLAGTIEAFNALKSNIKESLARLAGVPTSNVELIASPASINVEARFTPATSLNTDVSSIMTKLTTGAVTAALETLDLSVEAITAPTVITINAVADSPPPAIAPSPSSTPSPSLSPLLGVDSAQTAGDAATADTDADDSRTYIIIAAVFGCLTLFVLAALYCTCRRRRAKEANAPQYPSAEDGMPNKPKSPKGAQSTSVPLSGVTLIDVSVTDAGVPPTDDEQLTTTSDPSEDTLGNVPYRSNPILRIAADYPERLEARTRA